MQFFCSQLKINYVSRNDNSASPLEDHWKEKAEIPPCAHKKVRIIAKNGKDITNCNQDSINHLHHFFCTDLKLLGTNLSFMLVNSYF